MEVNPASTRLVVRSYEGESTASHPNCEVKHLSARSVLQWGTMWESRVLNCLFISRFAFFWPFVMEVNPGCTRLVVRSYEGESTASHPNCEVKHLSARSVLQWGTMWESRVLNCLSPFYFAFYAKKNFFEKNATPAENRTRDLSRVKRAS